MFEHLFEMSVCNITKDRSNMLGLPAKVCTLK